MLRPSAQILPARTPTKPPNPRLKGRVSDTYNRRKRVGGPASHKHPPAGRGDAKDTSQTRASHGDASQSRPASQRRVDGETPAGNGPDRHTRRPRARGCRVKQATDPEPSVHAEQWHPRPARARSRLDGVRTTRPPPTPSPRRSQVGERSTQRRQRIRPLRHITCAWGSGDRVHEGGASPTRRGMSPPAGSTAPRLLVEASLLLPRRPQQINRRAV